MVLAREPCASTPRSSTTSCGGNNYVTPKNYLDFISNYKRSLVEQRGRNKDFSARLDGGLQKLIQAATDVSTMQADLSKAKVEVKAKKVEVNELLEVIRRAPPRWRPSRRRRRRRKSSSRWTPRIAVEEAEAEDDLAKAIPALEAAREALKNLKKEDITEIKAFSKPRRRCRRRRKCVQILKKEKEINWAGAKLMLGVGDFLKSLQQYDKDAITDRMIKDLRAYTKEKNFNPEV